MKKGKLITRKKAAGATALLLSAVMLVGGAFAWQYYGDHKTNVGESGGLKYKARLVEKFDPNDTKEWNVTDPPVTKELRVSNPGKEVATDNSVYGDIFVRLQLKEFMEFYPLTYVYTDERYMTRPDGAESVTGESAAVEKKSGAFYAFDTQADAQAFADKLDLEFGNGPHIVKDVKMYGDTQERWFIQTKESDPNGVYGSFVLLDVKVDKTTGRNIIESDAGIPIPAKADDDQKSETDGGLHNDYNIGESTATPNGECLYTVHTWETGLYGYNVNANSAANPKVTFEDYIELVFGNDVILLSNWDGEPVNKWVVDDSTSSGWVYWGNPLAPQEETSNLIEQIQLIRQPDDAFYYALHADMEAVSYDQISDFNAPQEVVDAWTKASKKSIEVTAGPYVGLGTNNFQFTADETDVKWELVGNIDGVTIDPTTGVITVDGSVLSLGETKVPIGTKITARATTTDGRKAGTASTEVALPINATYFPDAAFMGFIANGDKDGNVFDTNGDGLLTKAEINAITDIFVHGAVHTGGGTNGFDDNPRGAIQNIAGVEYFVNLKNMNAQYNNINTITDFSKNINLKYLSLYDNQLPAINVEKNTQLETLNVGINSLTTLDVTKNINLKYLDCKTNNLNALDVAKNTLLLEFDCINNQITSLDLTQNIALTKLYCQTNKLTSLDVSKNLELVELNCGQNQILTIDVSKNTKLEFLAILSNLFTSLDVSKNPQLKTLYISWNKITSIDLSSNPELEFLHGAVNKITSIDLSANIKLEYISLTFNHLTGIVLTSNTNLTVVDILGQTSLDETGNYTMPQSAVLLPSGYTGTLS